MAKEPNAMNSMSFPPYDLDRVRGFAVLRRVETEDLVLLGHAQRYEEVDDLQDHERHDGGVGDNRGHGDELDAELRRVAIDQAVRSGAVHRAAREETGRDRAPRATDAVHAEDVERVVDAEPFRELDAEVADRAGAEADDDRRGHVDVPGRGRDRDKAGDRTGG